MRKSSSKIGQRGTLMCCHGSLTSTSNVDHFSCSAVRCKLFRFRSSWFGAFSSLPAATLGDATSASITRSSSRPKNSSTAGTSIRSPSVVLKRLRKTAVSLEVRRTLPSACLQEDVRGKSAHQPSHGTHGAVQVHKWREEHTVSFRLATSPLKTAVSGGYCEDVAMLQPAIDRQLFRFHTQPVGLTILRSSGSAPQQSNGWGAYAGVRRRSSSLHESWSMVSLPKR